MTRVLVAEDEGVIGIALEDALAEAGYAIAGPFSSCSRAEDWLRNDTPDLALLDVWLQDGPCFDLARVLRGRAVPVVFLSGGTAADLPEDLQDALWLEKPISFDALMSTLGTLAGEKDAGSWPGTVPNPAVVILDIEPQPDPSRTID